MRSTLPEGTAVDAACVCWGVGAAFAVLSAPCPTPPSRREASDGRLPLVLGFGVLLAGERFSMLSFSNRSTRSHGNSDIPSAGLLFGAAFSCTFFCASLSLCVLCRPPENSILSLTASAILSSSGLCFWLSAAVVPFCSMLNASIASFALIGPLLSPI